MTIYAAFFLPETKGVPLEEMQVLWSRHWFWGKFVKSSVRIANCIVDDAEIVCLLVPSLCRAWS